MIRRLLCWLGDLIGKDCHKWREFDRYYTEYTPDLIYIQEKCDVCGERRSRCVLCEKGKKC